MLSAELGCFVDVVTALCPYLWETKNTRHEKYLSIDSAAVWADRPGLSNTLEEERYAPMQLLGRCYWNWVLLSMSCLGRRPALNARHKGEMLLEQGG